MTDAPDPGLTADHTFQSGGGGDGYTEPFCFGAECSCGEVYESWVQSADDDEGHDFDLDRLADLHAAHVALVVEQHTNGRIAELEAAVRKRIQLLREHDGFGAAHADGYMGMNWTAYYEGAYQAQVMAAADLENDLRAALEGES